jgi:hypothetical protein
MSGVTNFVAVNPSAVNQETDTAYAADTQRSGGITTDAILTSQILNKKDYQYSIMIAALAQMLTIKGYSPVDGSPSEATGLVSPSAAQTALAGVLANIITNADLGAGYSSSLTGNGYIVFPTYFGGLTLQWGTQSYGGGGASANPLPAQTFPITFANAVFTMVASSNSISTNMVWMSVTDLSTSGFTLSFSTGGESANAFTARWFAVGY